jgi:RNA polymerase sigma factor (TIGR02999 family)
MRKTDAHRVTTRERTSGDCRKTVKWLNYNRDDMPRHDRVTELLRAWSAGDTHALDDLIPVVHDELARLARQKMAGERPGQTLQATALVNEAYLRLMDVKRVKWQDRAHFYAIAARVMRQILVDQARRRRALKRGEDPDLLQIEEAHVISAGPSYDLLALDDALNALEALDPRKARVVELRAFTGLTVEESAVALGVSAETVKRDWRLAKAWLSTQLTKKK